MKLITKISAAFLLLSSFGCSNNDNLPENPSQFPDAAVSLQVKASALKADNDMNVLTGEKSINNLTAIVFDATGKYLLGNPFRLENVGARDGSAKIIDIPAKATKAQIVIIANSPASILTGWTNYQTFSEKLAQLSDQSQDNLTMSTKLIVTKSELSAGDNFIGYENATNIDGLNDPIELTRLAARVEVVGVKTNFANSENVGRTVRIDSIYIENVKTASAYFSPEYWGAVFASGNLENSTNDALGQTLTDDTPVSSVIWRKYVMENTEAANATKVVVRATILSSRKFEPQTKIFSAVINTNGLEKGYDHNYIKRNYIYRLSLTFGPNSFDSIVPPSPPPPPDPTPEPEPTTGDLDVQVEVVGWGPVDQHIEIE